LFTGALAVEELSVVASIGVAVAEQQWALVGSAGLAAVDAAMSVLMASELSRGVAHATQLRAALALAQAQTAIGMELATVAQVALALGGSEFRAQRLLNDAQSLVVLPGAIEAIECGLLTVEQSSTVVSHLAVLDPPGQVAVWRRLQQRLIEDSSALPPARLGELLRRWVMAQDAEAAERRRREAEQSRGGLPQARRRAVRPVRQRAGCTGRARDPVPDRRPLPAVGSR
jgi:hypothetical protein